MAALAPVDVTEEEKTMMIYQSAKTFFSTVDLNKDGHVSFEEYLLSQAYMAFNTTMSPTIIEEVIVVEEPPPESSKRKSVGTVAPDAEYGGGGGKGKKLKPLKKKKNM